MSKLLDRLMRQLLAKGKDEKAAHAIATSALMKSGSLDKNGKPTAKGIRRGNMTPAERAIDRAVKTSGRRTSEYKYNSKTNRATLKHGR